MIWNLLRNIKVWPNIGWLEKYPRYRRRQAAGGRDTRPISTTRDNSKFGQKADISNSIQQKIKRYHILFKTLFIFGAKKRKKYRLNRTCEQSLYKQGVHSFWSGFRSLSTNYHCFLFQGFDWSTLVVDWFDESCDFISASQAVSGGRMVSDWRVVISLGPIRSSDSSKAGL